MRQFGPAPSIANHSLPLRIGELLHHCPELADRWVSGIERAPVLGVGLEDADVDDFRAAHGSSQVCPAKDGQDSGGNHRHQTPTHQPGGRHVPSRAATDHEVHEDVSVRWQHQTPLAALDERRAVPAIERVDKSQPIEPPYKGGVHGVHACKRLLSMLAVPNRRPVSKQLSQLRSGYGSGGCRAGRSCCAGSAGRSCCDASGGSRLRPRIQDALEQLGCGRVHGGEIGTAHRVASNQLPNQRGKPDVKRQAVAQRNAHHDADELVLGCGSLADSRKAGDKLVLHAWLKGRLWRASEKLHACLSARRREQVLAHVAERATKHSSPVNAFLAADAHLKETVLVVKVASERRRPRARQLVAHLNKLAAAGLRLAVPGCERSGGILGRDHHDRAHGGFSLRGFDGVAHQRLLRVREHQVGRRAQQAAHGGGPQGSRCVEQSQAASNEPVENSKQREAQANVVVVRDRQDGKGRALAAAQGNCAGPQVRDRALIPDGKLAQPRDELLVHFASPHCHGSVRRNELARADVRGPIALGVRDRPCHPRVRHAPESRRIRQAMDSRGERLDELSQVYQGLQGRHAAQRDRRQHRAGRDGWMPARRVGGRGPQRRSRRSSKPADVDGTKVRPAVELLGSLSRRCCLQRMLQLHWREELLSFAEHPKHPHGLRRHGSEGCEVWRRSCGKVLRARQDGVEQREDSRLERGVGGAQKPDHGADHVSSMQGACSESCGRQRLANEERQQPAAPLQGWLATNVCLAGPADATQASDLTAKTIRLPGLQDRQA
mmetsp:Transcript_18243/g.69039  ORF Transcript_18243/g.69039 Transcript_18243/m.69039 type:complete len:777 (+) Transcript_18243:261-2591(+)